jgi:hypothetical protein
MRPPLGRFVVEHSLRGRLRLRLPRDADLDRVTEALRGRPGVTAVTASPLTGGLLVRYDPERADADGLLEVVAGDAALERLAPAGPPPPSSGTLGEALSSAAAALDARVKSATPSRVGLATLVPVSFVLWAAGEIVRGRARPLAWTSALWYAHGIFRDYNREPPPRTDTQAP